MNHALLSELLGGAQRYKALRCLFEYPDKEFGARELSASAGIDASNASRWLRRWADKGILERRIENQRVRFVASTAPGLHPLRLLLQQDNEVSRVLRTSLESLDGVVTTAAIFGSSARGEARAGSDIDLLLITDLPRLQTQAHFKPAGRILARSVNVLSFTQAQWDEAERSRDTLVADILQNPVVVLKGSLQVAQT